MTIEAETMNTPPTAPGWHVARFIGNAQIAGPRPPHEIVKVIEWGGVCDDFMVYMTGVTAAYHPTNFTWIARLCTPWD